MAGSNETYEDETTEKYKQYPVPTAAFVQPLVTPAPALEHEQSTSTSSAVNQTPPAGRPFLPGATTFVAKQAPDQDPAARLPRDADSDDAEDLSDERLSARCHAAD